MCVCVCVCAACIGSCCRLPSCFSFCSLPSFSFWLPCFSRQWALGDTSQLQVGDLQFREALGAGASAEGNGRRSRMRSRPGHCEALKDRTGKLKKEQDAWLDGKNPSDDSMVNYFNVCCLQKRGSKCACCGYLPCCPKNGSFLCLWSFFGFWLWQAMTTGFFCCLPVRFKDELLANFHAGLDEEYEACTRSPKKKAWRMTAACTKQVASFFTRRKRGGGSLAIPFPPSSKTITRFDGILNRGWLKRKPRAKPKPCFGVP